MRSACIHRPTVNEPNLAIVNAELGWRRFHARYMLKTRRAHLALTMVEERIAEMADRSGQRSTV